MAEQNPIKYSDLISPDDSIEKLIEQLEKLDRIYNQLVNSAKAHAEELLRSAQSVSGATKQGQDATMELAQATASLGKSVKVTQQAADENAKAIEMLKEKARQEAREEKQIMKLKVEQSRALAGSYNALSAQYRQNKIILNSLTEEMRKNDPAAKKLEEETRKIYERMNQLQQATGKYSLNVGNYTASIEKAIGANSKWFQSLQMLAGLFQGGLTSGIKAAGSAVAGFGKQLLALLANPIVATIAAITAAFTALAKGVSTSEENTNALARIMAPFQRIMTGVVYVLQEAASFLLKGVEGMENMAMAASRLLERLPYVGSALKKVNDALYENVQLERERQRLQRENRVLTKEEAEANYEILLLRTKAAKVDNPKVRAALLKDAIDLENETSKRRIDYLERELKVMKQQADQSHNTAETHDEIAAKEAEIWQAKAAALQKNLRLETQVAKLSRENAGLGGKTDKTDKEKELKEQERLLKEKESRELKAIRQAEDAKIALVENMYDRERMMTIVRYDRQIEDLNKQLTTLADDEIETKKAVNETIIALEQQKWKELADIADKEMKEAVDRETKDAAERTKKAEEIAKKKKEEMKKRIDLYDILGFKIEEDQKKDIDEAVGYAIESLNGFMDAWTAAADARRDQADSEVERTQRVLEAEIEARNAGYANDVETARKELEEAKKNQQKAMQQQKQAHQAQIALDTATQASSLITATANIWKSFTSIGPWGIAAAIAATALMWGSFAAAKIKAFETVGMETETYGEGTVELLQGGSHQSGNDIDLGRKKDGTRRRAEGGEYFAVINKRSSKKYGNLIPDIINSLNRDTFAEKYMGAYDGAGVSVTVNGRNPDLKELTQSVNDIRDQGRMRTYVDGGNTVMVYKNLKRVVRNGN